METPDLPQPPPQPAAPSQRFPSWKQALLMLFGGIVLSISACFGFLISLGGNFERGGDPILSPLAGLLFVVGVLVAIVGVILVFIRIVRGVMHPDDAQPPSPGGDA